MQPLTSTTSDRRSRPRRLQHEADGIHHDRQGGGGQVLDGALPGALPPGAPSPLCTPLAMYWVLLNVMLAVLGGAASAGNIERLPLPPALRTLTLQISPRAVAGMVLPLWLWPATWKA
jgi:hypothetical protein